MGSTLFEIDLLTDHEPGIPGGETRDVWEARRVERAVAYGVSHGCGVALDFEPRRGDQDGPRRGWYLGECTMFCPPLLF